MFNLVKNIIVSCLLPIECILCFSFKGIQFYKDLLDYRKQKNRESEIHSVVFHGHQLYYRTMTTDITLIVNIVVRRYGQYTIKLGKDIKGILDLGANIGLFSIKYASKYPQATFIAVEPDEDNYKMLKMNTACYHNIITVQAGVWWRNAYLKVIDTGKGPYAYRVEETKIKNGKIKGKTIDELCQEYQVPADVVKMDIEGSEYPIFENLDQSSIWLEHTGLFIIETHDRLIPGCTNLVRSVLQKRKFKEKRDHEDLVFYRSFVIDKDNKLINHA